MFCLVYDSSSFLKIDSLYALSSSVRHAIGEMSNTVELDLSFIVVGSD